MSPLSSSLFERLRCAACRSALARGGPASRAPRDAPRCAPARPTFSARHTLVCGRCDARYPVVRDVPILLDGSKSLFDAGDCVAQVSGGRPAPTWKELARDEMERLVRPAGKNLAARPMIERLAAELRAESDSPRVLVIGGATLGIGMSALTSDPAFQLAESDVTIGPRTNVVLDACEIPFEDGTFDAVVAQAVFEYFPDPFRVAAEIHRVLRPRGWVYAESPFMQQVHGGAYDFYRFSHVGHRRLFRTFDEVQSGVACGPGMALAWSYRYFLRSLGRAKAYRAAASHFSNLTSRWLTRVDDRVGDTAAAYDAASAFYFLGRRAERALSDREILQAYRGTWKIRR